jgi:hypothetical protein
MYIWYRTRIYTRVEEGGVRGNGQRSPYTQVTRSGSIEVISLPTNYHPSCLINNSAHSQSKPAFDIEPIT